MKTLKTALVVCAAYAAVRMPLSGYAQATMEQSRTDRAQSEMVQAAPAMADGEVRRVDVDSGRVTIRHGYIKHLDMPSMTMVFTVKNKALLTTIKPGDKVQFMVISESGKMVITDITPSQ